MILTREQIEERIKWNKIEINELEEHNRILSIQLNEYKKQEKEEKIITVPINDLDSLISTINDITSDSSVKPIINKINKKIELYKHY